jgi:hypothetical protein
MNADGVGACNNDDDEITSVQIVHSPPHHKVNTGDGMYAIEKMEENNPGLSEIALSSSLLMTTRCVGHGMMSAQDIAWTLSKEQSETAQN